MLFRSTAAAPPPPPPPLPAEPAGAAAAPSGPASPRQATSGSDCATSHASLSSPRPLGSVAGLPTANGAGLAVALRPGTAGSMGGGGGGEDSDDDLPSVDGNAGGDSRAPHCVTPAAKLCLACVPWAVTAAQPCAQLFVCSAGRLLPSILAVF